MCNEVAAKCCPHWNKKFSSLHCNGCTTIFTWRLPSWPLTIIILCDEIDVVQTCHGKLRIYTQTGSSSILFLALWLLRSSSTSLIRLFYWCAHFVSIYLAAACVPTSKTAWRCIFLSDTDYCIIFINLRKLWQSSFFNISPMLLIIVINPSIQPRPDDFLKLHSTSPQPARQENSLISPVKPTKRPCHWNQMDLVKCK